MNYTVVGTRFYEGFFYVSVSQLQPCWYLGLGHAWLFSSRMFSSILPSTRASQAAQRKRIHLPMQETQEVRVRSLGWEDSPGGGNGNPCEYSCLEIPWTEEPGGLQSTGLQTVEHDWAHIPYPIASTYQPPVAPPVVTTKKHLLQKLPNVPSGAKSPSHWH